MPLTPWSSWILWLPLHSAGVQQFVALRSSSFLLPPLLIVYTTVYYNIYGSQHDGFDGFDGFSYQDPLRGKTLRVNSRHMYSTICGDMTSICDQCLHSPHETPRISHMYTDCCSEPVIYPSSQQFILLLTLFTVSVLHSYTEVYGPSTASASSEPAPTLSPFYGLRSEAAVDSINRILMLGIIS
jgi:hypothetical protein